MPFIPHTDAQQQEMLAAIGVDLEGLFADIPPAHIRNGIWQSAIHGRAASTVWVWLRSYVDEYTGEPIPDFPGEAATDGNEHGGLRLFL